MNELIVREIKMTSLELAEVTGKEHKNVMRDIRNEIEQLGDNGLIFELVNYTDVKGEKRPCYQFGRDGAMQLALKYDAITRRKVILKLEELEKQQIPTGQNLLALAVIEAQKVIEENQITIKEKDKLLEEQKPKVIFANAVTASEKSILIGELAKIIKQNGIEIGEKRLFEWLRNNGYLIKRKGTDYNAPTQKSMELRLFSVKETAITHADGHTTVSKTTKVTGKGQQYFINKFLAEKSVRKKEHN